MSFELWALLIDTRMSATLTLYLVRHGQTEYNATGRVQGWTDVPLDAIGLVQAERLAMRFSNKTLSAIYSSPLARAADTAYAIASTTNMPVILDDRLREYNMGQWSGLTGDEILAVTPGMVHWDGPERESPGGENARQMRDRVEAFLHDLVQKHTSGETVVAVSHGGTLGAVIAAMLGLPVLRRQPFTFGNTAITKVSYDHGQWRIRSLNDRCHLRQGDE